MAQKIAVELNERLSIMSRNQQLPTAETCELIIFDRWAGHVGVASVLVCNHLGWACEAQPSIKFHGALLLPAQVTRCEAGVNTLLIAQ